MRENVPLAPLTTFGIGGSATRFIEIETEDELHAVAHLVGDGFAVLGGGANLLVPDAGVNGTVIKVVAPGISFVEIDAHTVRVIAGAGGIWDAVVRAAAERDLWGIENLAGVPGTVGGAVVQNIGAYGAELAQTFEYAEVFDLASGTMHRIEQGDAAYGYRDSMFKHCKNLVVMRVGLVLRSSGAIPNLAYKDLQAVAEQGVPLSTPNEVGEAVRRIRTCKFPDLSKEGTAGSFFKNPILTRERADTLARDFPGMPQFAVPFGALPRPAKLQSEVGAQEGQLDGSVKISLAWLLDHVLALKGFARGTVRLFEHQPLVVVAARGTHAREVELFAQTIEKKVFAATGITLEREVETFIARKLSTVRE